MSKVCQITGKRARVGNNVSKAKNRTKRMFYPNLHVKKFYIPEEDKWITIKVCSSALKSINKDGISAVLKKAKEKGTLSIQSWQKKETEFKLFYNVQNIKLLVNQVHQDMLLQKIKKIQQTELN